MNTLKHYSEMIDRRLNELPPKLDDGRYEIGEMPWLLADSMRYSLTAGGKRLRSSMLLACTEMLNGPVADTLDFACAVEMIHTYSLIHDDLPGMDNDTMRRGRPTNHVVFGEGQAILAGDGLLSYAFETMLSCGLKHPENATNWLSAIHEVAIGAGVSGMVGGQVMDLYCEAHQIADEKALSYIQRNKTACMFMYPLRAAGRICAVNDAQLQALTEYGLAFGLLFQATDDLLDIVGTAEEMGKTLGKDAKNGKLTCISMYGIEGTRELVAQQHEIAVNAMQQFGKGSEFFIYLVDSMVNRTH